MGETTLKRGWSGRRVKARSAVIAALEVERWHYVADIWDTVGINAGRIYLALAELECVGWVESEWDSGEPPLRRRRYRLAQAVRDLRASAQRFQEPTDA